jgi:hypothetical protein
VTRGSGAGTWWMMPLPGPQKPRSNLEEEVDRKLYLRAVTRRGAGRPGGSLHFFVCLDGLCKIRLAAFELLGGLVLIRMCHRRHSCARASWGGGIIQATNLVGGDEVIAVHSGGHGSLVQPAADELRSI